MPQKEFNVSYLRKLKVPDQVEIKPVSEIISLIKNGSHTTTDNQWNFRRTGNVSFKHKMPAVIWAGETLRREDSAIQMTNGLMPVDFDDVHTAERFEMLHNRAVNDPSVLTFYQTPRGQHRSKGVFLTDITDPSLYKTAYKLLLEKLAEDDVYGQFKPDSSSCNVSHCQFVPYDPNVYYNPDPAPIELDSMARAVPYFSHYKAPISESREYLVLVLDKILEYYRKNFKGQISVCDDRHQWISYGFALFNTFSGEWETAEHYFREFSALSPKYFTMSSDDFESVVENISASNRNGNSILKILGDARKLGFDFKYFLKDLAVGTSGKFNSRDRLPPDHFPLIKKTEHLSDIQFDTGGNMLLESPTNSGKSEYFCKYAKGKRIMLVPTVDLVKQLVKENSTETNPIKAVYEGETVTGDEMIIIGTYDSIFKVNRLENAYEYELWLDEAHNFFLSSAMNFRNRQLSEIYESLTDFKRVVAMTGTHIDNDYLFGKNDGFEKVRVIQEDRPQKHLVLVETPDKKHSILNRLVRGQLNIIFYNNKEEGARLGTYLTNTRNFKVQLFNRDTKEQEDHQMIITNRLVKDDVEVLICTDSFKEGISLYNLDFVGIHIMGSVSWVDIEQLSSRPRNVQPPIYLYFSQNSEFYYKYFNINAEIHQRIEEAQMLANQLNEQINSPMNERSIADIERERSIICEKESRSPHQWLNIVNQQYEVNRLGCINDAYLQMKISHYTNPQQLLMELAPYDYRFSIKPDDIQKLKGYGVNANKMSDEEIGKFLAKYGKLSVEELGDLDTGDDALNEVVGRLYQISKHFRDTDINAAFRQHCTSKQAYASFWGKLEVQLFYEQLKKEAKEPILLNGMMKSFKVGNTYSKETTLKTLKKLQKESHLFKGVMLDNKRLVHYLRQYFDVKIKEKGGVTRYEILSKNVTGYPMDIQKIRKHSMAGLDYEF